MVFLQSLPERVYFQCNTRQAQNSQHFRRAQCRLDHQLSSACSRPTKDSLLRDFFNMDLPRSAAGCPAKPAYRPDIDGLRAIAVLSAVGFHAFPSHVEGGFIGVDMFFVISGFLIGTIIFDGLSQNAFSFIEFYGRRIRRIFPALLVVLVACYMFGWFALLTGEYAQLVSTWPLLEGSYQTLCCGVRAGTSMRLLI
jgi:hypothetical protein